MEKMVSKRTVFEHITVIEALCKGIYINYDKLELVQSIYSSINREITHLLNKCYFESKETLDELANMVSDCLDDPNSFGCLEEVYQIYVALLKSLIEIKNDNYFRDEKKLASISR